MREVSTGALKVAHRQGIGRSRPKSSVPSFITRCQLKAREFAHKDEIIKEIATANPSHMATIEKDGFIGYAMFISGEQLKKYEADANEFGIVKAYINYCTRNKGGRKAA